MINVLIVEDEPIVAADLAAKLAELGCRITGTAARAEEAIAQVRDQPPDLVLMDIRLAGPLDGIQAATEIRRFSDVPVIYLTAYSDPAILSRARLTEPFACIMKPFEDRELRQHIEQLRQQRQG